MIDIETRPRRAWRQNKKRDGIDPVDLALGLAVRRRRLMLGISQGQLAVMLNLSFQAVQKYENDENRMAVSRAVAVAERLGTTLAQLLADAAIDAPAPPPRLQSNWVAEMLDQLLRLRPAARRHALGLLRAINEPEPEGDAP